MIRLFWFYVKGKFCCTYQCKILCQPHPFLPSGSSATFSFYTHVCFHFKLSYTKTIFQQLNLKGLTLLNFQQKEGLYSVYWLYLLTEELIWICICNLHPKRFDFTTSGLKHGLKDSDTSSLLKNMTDKNYGHKRILPFTT